MFSKTAGMFTLTERITLEVMQGRCSLPAIAMAKAYNTKTGREVVSLAREMLGGNGIVLDYQVASKFADLETIHTYEGTYDINALVCGRAITGYAAIKSGEAVKNSLKAKKKQQQQRSKL